MSVKVRSHLDVKRRKGDFVGAFAVYGYAKDAENKNKLVPDDFAADVVRDIFKWKLEGISSHGIADKLNQKGILSPMEYKRFLGLRYNSTFKVNATAKWQAVSVKRILTNAVYTGVLEQGKRSKPNYKVRKCVEMPKEQWVRTENAHDPIISENIFNTVQEILKQDTRAVVRGKNVFPLSGIILCADCGSAMVRKTYPTKAYYVCSKHRADKDLCSTHTISAADCENAVLDALRLHTSAVLDIEKTLASIDTMAYQQAGIRKLTARLEAKREEIAKYNGFRLSLHESLSEGILSKDDFVNFKKVYDVKIAEAEAAIAQLEIEKSAKDESANHDWIGRFRGYGKVLERKTVAELIERVSVYEGGRISVTFRYHNEFSRLCPKKGVA
jgi:hypothetical protein